MYLLQDLIWKESAALKAVISFSVQAVRLRNDCNGGGTMRGQVATCHNQTHCTNTAKKYRQIHRIINT